LTVVSSCGSAGSEWAPVDAFPKSFAAHHAARQDLVDRYLVSAGGTTELTFRQRSGGPELDVFVHLGACFRDPDLRPLHVIPFRR